DVEGQRVDAIPPVEGQRRRARAVQPAQDLDVALEDQLGGADREVPGDGRQRIVAPHHADGRTVGHTQADVHGERGQVVEVVDAAVDVGDEPSGVADGKAGTAGDVVAQSDVGELAVLNDETAADLELVSDLDRTAHRQVDAIAATAVLDVQIV